MVDSYILERWVGDRKSGRWMVMVNDTNLKCFPKDCSFCWGVSLLKNLWNRSGVLSVAILRRRRLRFGRGWGWGWGLGAKWLAQGQLMNSSKRWGQRVMATLNKFFVRRWQIPPASHRYMVKARKSCRRKRSEKLPSKAAWGQLSLPRPALCTEPACGVEFH